MRGNSHPVEKIREGLMEEVMLEISFKGSKFQTQRYRRGDPVGEEHEQWPEG